MHCAKHSLMDFGLYSHHRHPTSLCISLSGRGALQPPGPRHAPSTVCHQRPSSSSMVLLPALDVLLGKSLHERNEPGSVCSHCPHRHWSHFKQSLGRENIRKLIFIFPGSLKITGKFLLIIHSKVPPNSSYLTFSSLFYSAAHWRCSCHHRLSFFSHNFLKLPLKPDFCFPFRHFPHSLPFWISQVPNPGSFQVVGSPDYSNSSQWSSRGRGEKHRMNRRDKCTLCVSLQCGFTVHGGRALKVLGSVMRTTILCEC